MSLLNKVLVLLVFLGVVCTPIAVCADDDGDSDGFAPRFQRGYNPFTPSTWLTPGSPTSPAATADPDSVFAPANRAAAGNPYAPHNRAHPDSPWAPSNSAAGWNPLAPHNRANPDAKFAPPDWRDR